MKKLLYFAALYVLCASSMVSATHKLTIMTSDSQNFTYDQEKIAALKVSGTINNLLDDLGDPEDAIVPLPGIDAPCWQNIFKCLQVLVDDKIPSDEAKKNKLDKEIAQLTEDALCTLLNGCDYLHVTDILLDRALERCSAEPELVLRALSQQYHFYPSVQEALKKKLAKYLHVASINNSRKPITQISLRIPYSSITASCFSSGNKFVSGFNDGSICIWDVAGDDEPSWLQGHKGRIDFIRRLSNDRNLIMSGSSTDSSIRFWDTTTEQRIFITNHLNNSPISENDPYVAVSDSFTGNIELFDRSTGQCIQTFNHPEVQSIAVSKAARQLATIARDGIIYIWDIRSGANIKQIPTSNMLTAKISWLDQQGEFLEALGIFFTRQVWHIPTEKLVYELNGVDIRGTCENHICYGQDKTIKLFNFRTGHPIRSFEGHLDKVTIIDCPNRDFLEDENFLVTGSTDRTVRIWNVHTGDMIHTINHELPVQRVGVSENGNYLATTTSDGKLHLWDFMAKVQKLIDRSSLEQCLLLALGYQKHQAQRSLSLMSKSPLSHLLDAYNEEQQALIQQLLPIKRIQELSKPSSLLTPAYKHKNSTMRRAAGALGLAWHQKAKFSS